MAHVNSASLFGVSMDWGQSLANLPWEGQEQGGQSCLAALLHACNGLIEADEEADRLGFPERKRSPMGTALVISVPLSFCPPRPQERAGCVC